MYFSNVVRLFLCSSSARVAPVLPFHRLSFDFAALHLHVFAFVPPSHLLLEAALRHDAHERELPGGRGTITLSESRPLFSNNTSLLSSIPSG